MTETEFTERCMLMLRRNEGYKNRVYKDKEGHLTIGIGHKLEAGSKLKLHDYVSDAEIERLFKADFKKFYARARQIPGFDKYTTQQKMALVDLTFNMGAGWTKKFKNAYKFINKANEADNEIIRAGYWRMASAELKFRDPHKNDFSKTKYYNQVGSRAERNAKRFMNVLEPEEDEWETRARSL